MRSTPLFLFFFITVAHPATHSQVRPFATTIRGEYLDRPDSIEVMMILYNSAHCHQCMQSLSDYAVRWSQKKAGRSVIVLVPGLQVTLLRNEASNIPGFFPKNNCPPIVYDRIPNVSDQYTAIYQITHFPAVIMWYPDGRKEYFSYEQMFRSKKPRFPK